MGQNCLPQTAFAVTNKYSGVVEGKLHVSLYRYHYVIIILSDAFGLFHCTTDKVYRNDLKSQGKKGKLTSHLTEHNQSGSNSP